jgi:hypothetical protein
MGNVKSKACLLQHNFGNILIIVHLFPPPRPIKSLQAMLDLSLLLALQSNYIILVKYEVLKAVNIVTLGPTARQ